MNESASEVEIWRDIPGYVGYYQVSNFGRVRSLVRYLPEFDVLSGVRIPKCYLRPSRTGPSGRPGVSLSINGRNHKILIHRLVLLAFKGPRPKGLEACHNDGNHLNNALGNLRWDTRKSNVEDAVRHGTVFRKLTEREVLDIRASDLPSIDLAHIYEVSQVTIRDIRARKFWRHI
jgi:HNH endonuclease/NUMOD4 motif